MSYMETKSIEIAQKIAKMYQISNIIIIDEGYILKFDWIGSLKTNH
jgi:hypothetical protein